MLLPCALLVLLSGPASAQEPDPDPAALPSPESRPTPADRLDEAIRVYLSGDLPTARNMLIVLVQDPEVKDPDLLQEARLWLGEVQYLLGETQAAESSFRAALAHDPTLRMDTFDHPPEVVSFFNSIQAQVLTRDPEPRPDPRPVEPPAPSLALFLLPGGGQFHNGQPGWGAVTLGTVGLTAMTTLGFNLYLRQFDEMPDERGIQILVHQGQRDKEALARLQRTRTIQWTIASVGMLGWSTSLGVGLVQRPRPTELSLVVSPTGLGMNGSF